MEIAKIHLNNSETLTIKEGDELFGIRTKPNEAPKNIPTGDEYHYLDYPLTASISRPLQIDSHHHAGLIPNLVELFDNYSFFQFEENASVSYSTSAVTKIELIDF